MAWPLILSRRRITTGEWTIDVDADTSGGAGVEIKTFAAGYYYNDSTTAAESLRNQLRVLLDSHTDAATFTVTYSTTTGKFTITSSGPIFSVTWNQAATRRWFGFNGNLSGAATYTSDNVAQGAIFTNSGRHNFSDYNKEYSHGTVVAESGVTAHVASTARRLVSEWDHQFEPPAFVSFPLASGTRDNSGTMDSWAWEDFWNHHTRNAEGSGEPWRVYTASGLGIGNYEAENVLTERMYDKFIGVPHTANRAAYWTVRISARLYTAAT